MRDERAGRAACTRARRKSLHRGERARRCRRARASASASAVRRGTPRRAATPVGQSVDRAAEERRERRRARTSPPRRGRGRRSCCPRSHRERIERHTAGLARHRERSRAGGRHVRRGLLLHGPPGTGKTLTVMYLAGLMPERTVVLLSGAALARSARRRSWRARSSRRWWCRGRRPDRADRGTPRPRRCCSSCSTRWTASTRTPTSSSRSPRTAPRCSSPRSSRGRDASTWRSSCRCRMRTRDAGSSSCTPGAWSEVEDW